MAVITEHQNHLHFYLSCCIINEYLSSILFNTGYSFNAFHVFTNYPWTTELNKKKPTTYLAYVATTYPLPNNNFEKRNIFVLLLRIGAFLIKKLNLCLWAQIRHITVSCLLTGKKSAGLNSDCHLLTRGRPGLFCSSKYHNVTTTALRAILLNILPSSVEETSLVVLLCPTLFCQQ